MSALQQLCFEGIGTHWKIIYYLPEGVQSVDDFCLGLEFAITDIVEAFDTNYSRFKKDSLVWQLATCDERTHELSSEFTDILQFGQRLMKLTNGRFNPAVGMTLERLGYDTEYSFEVDENSDQVNLDWWLEGNVLHTPNPVLLDIGGWGKGYLIDLLVKLLIEHGVKRYLVDGGGDVRGTYKANDDPWKIALGHPLDRKQAFGMVELQDMAMASTGAERRRFGEYHHLIDAVTQEPRNDLQSVHVQASSASVADGAATALFVSGPESIDVLAGELGIEYLVVFPDLSFKRSAGFEAAVFAEA